MVIDRIRDLCLKKGISIPKLEEALGFGAGTITRWKKSEPGVDKILKVANFFNVTTDYLLGKEIPANSFVYDVYPSSFSDKLYEMNSTGISHWCNNDLISDEAKAVLKENAADLLGKYKLLIESYVNALIYLLHEESNPEIQRIIASKENTKLFLEQYTNHQTQELIYTAKALSTRLALYGITTTETEKK